METQTDAVTLDDVIEAAEKYANTLDAATRSEECGFCAQTLIEAQALPLEDQIQTLRELKTFEELMMQETVPDEEEIRGVTDEFEYVDV